VSIDDILELRQVGAPDISPDGTQIVYALGGWEHPDARNDSVRGDRHETRSHLWLVASEGGEPRQLTRGERSESAAAWSPDGRQLAFLAARGTGTEAMAQVWLLPMDGGEARQVTRSRESVQSFVWSPDGTRIAFVTQDTLATAAAAKRRRQDDAQVFESSFRQNHIWVQEVQATSASRDWGPARLEAMSASRDGGPAHLEAMSASRDSGPAATEVAHGDFTVRGLPSWSPDGRQLVFAASVTPLIRDLGGAIYVVTLESKDVRRIAEIAHSPATLLGQPQWSPDGRTISFVTVPEVQRVNPDSMLQAELNYSRLVLYDVASGNARQAFDPNLLAEIGNLTWTRDGRRLIFAASEGVYQGVYEYDVASDRFSRIAGDLLLGGFSFSRWIQGRARAADAIIAKRHLHRRRRLRQPPQAHRCQSAGRAMGAR
jgi:Tol biopolymer transport system component